MNSITSTPAQRNPSRAPAARPAARAAKTVSDRLIVLVGDFREDGYGLLTLAVDGISVDYTLESIGSDWGDGFRLTKHVGSAADECPVYHVHLSDEGHTCDCPGGIYSTPKTGRPCKHLAALLQLRTAGKI